MTEWGVEKEIAPVEMTELVVGEADPCWMTARKAKASA
jgi:hypothetical protein